MGMASVAITTSGMGNCKKPGSVANEITIPVNIRSKGENEHKKINRWENGKQFTHHSELHDTSTTVGSGHWYKKWPYLKGHDPTDCHMLVFQQGKS